MTKREKIILGATAIVIVAGVLNFIIDLGPGTPPPSSRADLKAVQNFANLTAEEMKKTALTETQDYILERASVEWTSDPFLGKQLAGAETAKAAKLPVSLAYTGFLIVGLERLAIINGTEYEVGEKVQGSELVVQSIDPQNVVVKPLEGQQTFNIPFSGETLK